MVCVRLTQTNVRTTLLHRTNTAILAWLFVCRMRRPDTFRFGVDEVGRCVKCGLSQNFKINFDNNKEIGTSTNKLSIVILSWVL